MGLATLFSVPVGISNHKEIIPDALKCFEREDLFMLTDDNESINFQTTLRGYNRKKPTDDLTGEAADNIKKAIIEEATLFALEFGYDAERYDFTVTNLWMNSMQSGAIHKSHTHYGHTFSGCFYVQLPENANKIMFMSPNTTINKAPVDVAHYTVHNSATWTLDVAEGDLIIWESHLRHEVPALEFEGSRLCMAFDIDITYKE